MSKAQAEAIQAMIKWEAYETAKETISEETSRKSTTLRRQHNPLNSINKRTIGALVRSGDLMEIEGFSKVTVTLAYDYTIDIAIECDKLITEHIASKARQLQRQIQEHEAIAHIIDHIMETYGLKRTMFEVTRFERYGSGKWEYDVRFTQQRGTYTAKDGSAYPNYTEIVRISNSNEINTGGSSWSVEVATEMVRLMQIALDIIASGILCEDYAEYEGGEVVIEGTTYKSTAFHTDAGEWLSQLINTETNEVVVEETYETYSDARIAAHSVLKSAASFQEARAYLNSVVRK